MYEKLFCHKLGILWLVLVPQKQNSLSDIIHYNIFLAFKIHYQLLFFSSHNTTQVLTGLEPKYPLAVTQLFPKLYSIHVQQCICSVSTLIFFPSFIQNENLMPIILSSCKNYDVQDCDTEKTHQLADRQHHNTTVQKCLYWQIHKVCIWERSYK